MWAVPNDCFCPSASGRVSVSRGKSSEPGMQITISGATEGEGVEGEGEGGQPQERKVARDVELDNFTTVDQVLL